MKIWALFNDASYALTPYEDAEVFNSIRDAKDTLYRRVKGREREFPSVTRDAEFVCYKYNPVDVYDAYPDFILKVGPRGGIVKELT